MDEILLDQNQRDGIRMWAQMIRSADEERAVRLLTKIVLNLTGDKLALDAALAATKGKAMN
jgi:hypothetical protein